MSPLSNSEGLHTHSDYPEDPDPKISPVPFLPKESDFFDPTAVYDTAPEIDVESDNVADSANNQLIATLEAQAAPEKETKLDLKAESKRILGNTLEALGEFREITDVIDVKGDNGAVDSVLILGTDSNGETRYHPVDLSDPRLPTGFGGGIYQILDGLLGRSGKMDLAKVIDDLQGEGVLRTLGGDSENGRKTMKIIGLGAKAAMYTAAAGVATLFSESDAHADTQQGDFDGHMTAEPMQGGLSDLIDPTTYSAVALDDNGAELELGANESGEVIYNLRTADGTRLEAVSLGQLNANVEGDIMPISSIGDGIMPMHIYQVGGEQRLFIPVREGGASLHFSATISVNETTDAEGNITGISVEVGEAEFLGFDYFQLPAGFSSMPNNINYFVNTIDGEIYGLATYWNGGIFVAKLSTGECEIIAEYNQNSEGILTEEDIFDGNDDTVCGAPVHVSGQLQKAFGVQHIGDGACKPVGGEFVRAEDPDNSPLLEWQIIIPEVQPQGMQDLRAATVSAQNPNIWSDRVTFIKYNPVTGEHDRFVEARLAVPITPPECGDGDINQAWEDCDTNDLDGMTCQQLGDYISGTLHCDPLTCTFDFRDCVPTPPDPECGDGEINQAWEECDLEALDGMTCQQLGDYISGTLHCDPLTCTFDFRDCVPTPPDPECGDGDINQAWEECDTNDLNGKTCQELGDYISGTLHCDPLTCTFDFRDCVPTPPDPECGDGEINQVWEECDLEALNGMTCAQFAEYISGTLHCDPETCRFDFRECVPVPQNPVFEMASPDAGCYPVVNEIQSSPELTIVDISSDGITDECEFEVTKDGEYWGTYTWTLDETLVEGQNSFTGKFRMDRVEETVHSERAGHIAEDVDEDGRIYNSELNVFGPDFWDTLEENEGFTVETAYSGTLGRTGVTEIGTSATGERQVKIAVNLFEEDGGISTVDVIVTRQPDGTAIGTFTVEEGFVGTIALTPSTNPADFQPLIVPIGSIPGDDVSPEGTDVGQPRPDVVENPEVIGADVVDDSGEPGTDKVGGPDQDNGDDAQPVGPDALTGPDGGTGGGGGGGCSTGAENAGTGPLALLLTSITAAAIALRNTGRRRAESPVGKKEAKAQRKTAKQEARQERWAEKMFAKADRMEAKAETYDQKRARLNARLEEAERATVFGREATQHDETLIEAVTAVEAESLPSEAKAGLYAAHWKLSSGEAFDSAISAVGGSINRLITGETFKRIAGGAKEIARLTRERIREDFGKTPAQPEAEINETLRAYATGTLKPTSDTGSFMRAHSASANKAKNPALPVLRRSKLTKRDLTEKVEGKFAA